MGLGARRPGVLSILLVQSGLYAALHGDATHALPSWPWPLPQRSRSLNHQLAPTSPPPSPHHSPQAHPPNTIAHRLRHHHPLPIHQPTYHRHAHTHHHHHHHQNPYTNISTHLCLVANHPQLVKAARRLHHTGVSTSVLRPARAGRAVRAGEAQGDSNGTRIRACAPTCPPSSS